MLGDAGTVNVQGESEKKLDVHTNEQLIAALRSGGECCILVSDGSSNIDVNVGVGTIFSIYRRKSVDGRATIKDVLQKCAEQVIQCVLPRQSKTELHQIPLYRTLADMERVLSCLVIDDDPEVNAYVCEMIRETPFLYLSGTFANASAALNELETRVIDLLILDINLPGIDGLTFAAALKNAGSPAPRVILISGSREYAVDGYKVDAVDYLVKPFGYEDFYRAVLKVRGQVAIPKTETVTGHLFLKVEHDLVRVNISDISYLESFKDYVKVFTGDKMIMALSTLKAMEERLAGHRFMRIHRSFIVNLDKIESIQHLTVRFGKTIIPVTEQYRGAFRAEFRDWL